MKLGLFKSFHFTPPFRLNDILTINERDVLEHFGHVTKQLADEMAERQYERFKVEQQAVEKGESLKALEADLKEMGRKKKI